MKKLLLAVGIAATSLSANAWDGYDKKSDSYITIDPGSRVFVGKDIEILDQKLDQYKEVRVESVREGDRSVVIEVFDYEQNEYRHFEMN